MRGEILLFFVVDLGGFLLFVMVIALRMCWVSMLLYLHFLPCFKIRQGSDARKSLCHKHLFSQKKKVAFG